MADPFSIATGVASLISLTSEIIKITHAYVHDVKNASNTAKELNRTLAALATVLEQLERLLKREVSASPVFKQTSVLFKNYDACKATLQKIHVKLERHSRQSAASLLWPFKEKEHQKAVADIHIWMQIFHYALDVEACELLARTAGEVSTTLRVQLQTLDDTKKISKSMPSLLKGTENTLNAVLNSVLSLSRMETDVEDIKSGNQTLLNNQVTETRSRERKEVLQWIFELDFRPKQIDILARRSATTGTWLIETEEFQQWLRGEGSSCLWCPGIPGSGKTVLTSTVVQYLENNRPTDRTVIAFIFFDYKDSKIQTVPAIMANLLRQILEHLPNIPREVQSLYDSRLLDRSPKKTTTNQWVTLIELLCKRLRRTFLVVDALDECPELDDQSDEVRAKMVSALLRLSKVSHVFVTSRPNVDAAAEIPCTTLKIQAKESDLRCYLRARKADHTSLRKIVSQNTVLEKILEDTICQKSNGMFLLAQLQIDSLVHQTSARSIYKALDHLPKTLNDTYHDALQRIRRQPLEYSTLAEQVISWIFYAKRPLKLAELREALAVDPGDTELDPSGFHEPGLLLRICCGLVIADREDGIIGLVHHSLQQFLATFWKQHSPNAELMIATTCLTYVCFDEFSISLRNEEQLHERKGKYPFLSYASRYWATHVGNGFEKDLENLVLQFLESENWSHNVFCVSPVYPRFEFERLPNKTLPLHFAASCGLTHIMGILIREGANVEARDNTGNTPLDLAAGFGCYEAALLLLDSGADANSTTSRGLTPLSFAVSDSNYSIAKLLLEHGADVNMSFGIDGNTQISTAIEIGERSMINLLLQYNADVNAVSKHGHTPLELAVCTRDLPAVKLLLQHGADPNKTSIDGLIILDRAVLHRNQRTEQTLTTERSENSIMELPTYIHADPIPFGFPPLHEAVNDFWEEGIDILIAAGADPLYVDTYGLSCLDIAWPFETLFSRLRQDRAAYVPTSNSRRHARLVQSVRSLIFIILQNIEYCQKSTDSRISFRLGICLLQLGDAQEATTVFEQTAIHTRLGLTHFASCDICEVPRITGSRFVCCACRNIDLCSGCIGKYVSTAPNPRCIGHDFLEVPGPYWDDLEKWNKEHPEGKRMNMRDETLVEWLERLRSKYSF